MIPLISKPPNAAYLAAQASKQQQHSFASVYQSTALQFGLQRRKNTPTVFMFDLDDTFLRREKCFHHPDQFRFNGRLLQASTQSIQCYRSETDPYAQVWLNTGRSLKELKGMLKNHPELFRPLRTFKLDGLVLEYGRKIYINRTDKTMLPWIQELPFNSYSKAYAKHLKTQGWPGNLSIQNHITQALEQANYTETRNIPFPRSSPDGTVSTFVKYMDDGISTERATKTRAVVFILNSQASLRFAIYPPESYGDAANFLWNVTPPEYQRFAQTEFQHLKQLIGAQFYHHNAEVSIQRETSQYPSSLNPKSSNSWFRIFFFPMNVNKATATQWLLDHYFKNTKNIITAGDNPMMDRELLTSQYSQQNPYQRRHTVKRHAIICDSPVSQGDFRNIPALAKAYTTSCGALSGVLQRIFKTISQND